MLKVIDFYLVEPVSSFNGSPKRRDAVVSILLWSSIKRSPKRGSKGRLYQLSMLPQDRDSILSFSSLVRSHCRKFNHVILYYDGRLPRPLGPLLMIKSDNFPSGRSFGVPMKYVVSVCNIWLPAGMWRNYWLFWDYLETGRNASISAAQSGRFTPLVRASALIALFDFLEESTSVSAIGLSLAFFGTDPRQTEVFLQKVLHLTSIKPNE